MLSQKQDAYDYRENAGDVQTFKGTPPLPQVKAELNAELVSTLRAVVGAQEDLILRLIRQRDEAVRGHAAANTLLEQYVSGRTKLTHFDFQNGIETPDV